MLGCLLYATKDAEILNADADLSVKMANRGLLHGFLITRMIDKNMDTESLTIMSAVSIGEGYLGYKYSKSTISLRVKPTLSFSTMIMLEATILAWLFL